MSKFIDIIIDFISYDAALATKSPADATKIKTEVSESDVKEVFRFQENIPTATVDKDISIPSASAEYLLIFGDQQVSIKVNGGDSITLTPKTPETKSPLFFLRSTITSLSISNSSGSTAKIDIIAVNI